ncbi:hypothetical protein P4O66_021227 [Electrophorus voltai]|uniref:ribonuclease H n=1 Tax=Electrophorus voltai TaxID=2609070 RepID=A0AAD9E3N7_9TELE|nr:hypothetical protein P4O66_021227 [Electrophorus voltai]
MRGANMLDLINTNISSAYQVESCPHLGYSDHMSVMLIPAYRLIVRCLKPLLKQVRISPAGAISALQDCFEQMTWITFKEAATDSDTVNLEEYTASVIGYISKCIDDVTISNTIITCPNQKPWMTAEVRMLLRTLDSAFKAGGKEALRKTRAKLSQAIREAKRAHAQRIHRHFKDTGDIRHMWEGIQAIMNYTKTSPSCDSDTSLPDTLNEFYAWFEAQNNIAAEKSITLQSDQVLCLTVAEVRECADQLSNVLTDIFNVFLSCTVVPICFKTTTIAPVPKKSTASFLNDYSHRTHIHHHEGLRETHHETCQHPTSPFSGPPAISTTPHLALTHLDKNGTYLRMLFIDFSSAFSTIVPRHLIGKLSLLGLNTSLCNWILDFLTGRPQSVRIGNSTFNSTTPNTGAPQGSVLSPLLFTLLTHDCAAMHSLNYIIKFADETTVVGLISKDGESAYREEVRELRDHSPLTINGSSVEIIKNTKFLGVHLAKNLTWTLNTSSITKKAQQCLYFLQKLRKAHLPSPILTTFYRGLTVRHMGPPLLERDCSPSRQCCLRFCHVGAPACSYPSLSLGPVMVPAVWTCLESRRNTGTSGKHLGNRRPPHRPYDMAINLLLGSSPPRGCLFSLSGPERQAMDEYIQESLALGFIRPSTSPAGAGFFFVGKKDGGLRPCVDHQGLNRIIVKDRYPLPLMTSAFQTLQQASVFTKLDLHIAYNLVRIREGDEWKTAFITPSGHYEYLLMPFGLMNAPAAFQRYINEVLREALDRYMFVYLDDILIYSQTVDEHVTHVRRVLQLLLENHLFVKMEKSTFHAQTISFLGFIISHHTLCMDPAKVMAVESWLRPTSVCLIQRFLGFTNFSCMFVKSFSTITAPLTALTRKASGRFCWSTEAQQAFKEVKHRLIMASILRLPDAELPFIVEVDASENYDVGDSELLAVKIALKEWRHWLEGAKHPFLVWTDHKNLTYIQQAKRLNLRQARWGLFFARFDFTLSYRPGTKNIKPDALSHQWESSPPSAPPSTVVPRSCIVAPIQWGVEKAVHQALMAEPDPAGGPPGWLLIKVITVCNCNINQFDGTA